jgi:hypothetical protein
MVASPVALLMSKMVMCVLGCGANWRVMPRPIPEAPPATVSFLLFLFFVSFSLETQAQGIKLPVTMMLRLGDIPID